MDKLCDSGGVLKVMSVSNQSFMKFVYTQRLGRH